MEFSSGTLDTTILAVPKVTVPSITAKSAIRLLAAVPSVLSANTRLVVLPASPAVKDQRTDGNGNATGTTVDVSVSQAVDGDITVVTLTFLDTRRNGTGALVDGNISSFDLLAFRSSYGDTLPFA